MLKTLQAHVFFFFWEGVSFLELLTWWNTKVQDCILERYFLSLIAGPLCPLLLLKTLGSSLTLIPIEIVGDSINLLRILLRKQEPHLWSPRIMHPQSLASYSLSNYLCSPNLIRFLPSFFFFYALVSFYYFRPSNHTLMTSCLLKHMPKLTPLRAPGS